MNLDRPRRVCYNGVFTGDLNMTPKQAAQMMRLQSFIEEKHSDRFGSPPKGFDKLWRIPHEFKLALADVLAEEGVTPDANDDVSLIVWNVVQLGAEFGGHTFDEFMIEVRSWVDDWSG